MLKPHNLFLMILGIDYAKSDGLTLENCANFNRMDEAHFNILLKYFRKYSLIILCLGFRVSYVNIYKENQLDAV